MKKLSKEDLEIFKNKNEYFPKKTNFSNRKIPNNFLKNKSDNFSNKTSPNKTKTFQKVFPPKNPTKALNTKLCSAEYFPEENLSISSSSDLKESLLLNSDYENNFNLIDHNNENLSKKREKSISSENESNFRSIVTIKEYPISEKIYSSNILRVKIFNLNDVKKKISNDDFKKQFEKKIKKLEKKKILYFFNDLKKPSFINKSNNFKLFRPSDFKIEIIDFLKKFLCISIAKIEILLEKSVVK